MRIFIRVDGGNIIGLGHIMRMLVLAKELSNYSEVYFLCRKSINNSEKFKDGISKIKENKFIVLEISEESVVDDIISLQQKYCVELLITDSYDVNEEYFNRLKPHFRSTGYVDDINSCKMNVDFIINQNISAEYINYAPNININTKLFLGLKYCMLRNEFRKNHNKKQAKKMLKISF